MQEINRRVFLKLLGAAALCAGKLNPDSSSAARYPDPGVTLLGADRYASGIIIPHHLPVFFFPLRSDYFYYPQKPVIRLLLNSPTRLGYRGLFSFAFNSSYCTGAIFPNITGDEKIFAVGLLSVLNPRDISAAQMNYSPVNRESILAEYTLTGEFYPHKLINLLLESLSLLEFQQRNGAFQAGREYSLLDIVLDQRGSSFLPAKNNQGTVNPGEVVCGGASLLAKSCFLAGAEISNTPQRIPYWIGPTNPEKLTTANSDAAAEITRDGKRLDLKWTMPDSHPSYFLDISAAVFPNQMPPPLDGIGDGRAGDARLILNYTWTSMKSTSNIKNIQQILEAYQLVERTGFIPGILKENKVLNPQSLLSADEESQIFDFLYITGKVLRFKEELSTIPYLKEVQTLADLINRYADETTGTAYKLKLVPGIGDYLKGTSWYRSLSQTRKEEIEDGLVFSNYSTYLYREQAFQCLGWVVLLAHLAYRESPSKIGGLEGYPKDFVPEEITQLRLNSTTRYGFLFERPGSIDDFDVGDMFIDYMYPWGCGHIGAIIGKKTSNNETVLLATDANRDQDGKITLFEIDYTNYPGILGKQHQVRVSHY